MKKLSIIVILLAVLFSFAVVSTAFADGTNTSAIAGTWYGNMLFPNNANQRIVANIQNCTPGNVCGSVYNYMVQCKWELTFDGMQGGAYVFHHSRTLSGACLAQGTSYYTPQANGSLQRVQVNPLFTATGYLFPRAFASK